MVWGIGLLTVTTAVLLDTLLGTFDRDALLADLDEHLPPARTPPLPVVAPT